MLEILTLNLDKVDQHEALLSKVWGPQNRDDVEYLRVCIARIRRKTKDSLQEKEEYIITYHGLGYMLKSIYKHMGETESEINLKLPYCK